MHELSLCRSIDSIVRRAADGRKVAVIELDVGELRQVVPATLEHCWALLTPGTLLEGSTLSIRRIPAVIVCAGCGAETTLTDLPIMECGVCHGSDVKLVSGDEFIVTSLQLEV